MRGPILKSATAIAAVFAMIGATSTAVGAGLTLGNLIVSGTPTTIREYTPTGTLVQTLPSSGSGSFTTGMCFDASGNLLVTNFSQGTVAQFSAATGALVTSTFLNPGGAPEACVRDAAGNFYTTNTSGTKPAITKFSPTGTQLATFLPNTRSDWMDLAADQCTMYWDDEGTTQQIHRFNICNGTALSDLGGSGEYTAIRVLPGSGDIIVANEGLNRVDRFSSTGTLLGSWTPTGTSGSVFSLNLDPDGQTFWTGDTGGKVFRFSLSSFGPQITSFATANTQMFGVALVGEITVGAPPPTGGVNGSVASQIPTLSEWGLILLGLAVAGLGVVAIRKRRA
ncbi:MAG TPA: IPTL-CTERM sorting domain-containing protein [Burkholderiales bacterium]|nr:IPTL-CTERM sorting domain-containing protein [Burkholderiales bacterium]